MHIDIKIAVTPVVKAFLQSKYCVDPFELSQDNQYGIFLFNSLRHVKKVWSLKPDPDKDEKPITAFNTMNTVKYSEEMRIRLTERTFRRQGTFIHPSMQRAFNSMVVYELNERFYMWVDIRTANNKVQLKDAFLEFREKYSLTEDNLPLKTMEKKYERYRHDLSA